MLPAGRTPSGHVAIAPVHGAPLRSLYRHEDGRPVAMASYSGAKDDCELPVAQKLIEESASLIENATITGDALHTQKKNQENYHKHAENLLKDGPVDLVGELERGHGRFEVRDITIAAVDTEVSPFPHIAQIIKCTRIYRDVKEGAEPEMSVRLFGTSHEYGSKTAAQLGKMIREHWSVENLNHRELILAMAQFRVLNDSDGDQTHPYLAIRSCHVVVGGAVDPVLAG